MAKNSPRLTILAIVLTVIFIIVSWRPLSEGFKTRLTLPLSPATSQSSPSQPAQKEIATTNSWEDIAIPEKVWQTSKDPVTSLDQSTWSIIRSWTDHNPHFRHEVLTSDISNTYVQEKFSDDQDIKDTFLQLEAAILRADLIRYLVLYADGGIYNDLDVKCLKPVKNWFSPAVKSKASIVVGIEVDVDSKDGSHRLGFASWTIMAKPNHPAMEYVVRSVVGNLKTLAKTQNTDIAGIQVKYDDVIGTTGPRALTQGLLGYLSQSTGTEVNYLNFTKITEPTFVEDILVLPINSFGSGQAHSGSGSPNDESALAQHLWKGSWKKKPSESIKTKVTVPSHVSTTDIAPVETPQTST